MKSFFFRRLNLKKISILVFRLILLKKRGFLTLITGVSFLTCISTQTYATGIFSFSRSNYYLKKHISSAELKNQLPKGLLHAIITVESNFNPYAVNISGKTFSVKSKHQAVKIIKRALNEGITNIDIGLAQINYRWHNNKFKSVEAMISPINNINYAARFLFFLFKEHGTWHKAIRSYHSINPEYHKRYLNKVILSWYKHLKQDNNTNCTSFLYRIF